jgi:3-methylfumaryl-CoA hydratase
VFHDALRIGDEIVRGSEITELTVADGPEVSLTIRHNIESPRGAAIVEEREFFFLEAGASDVASAPAAPGETSWRREIDPDPVLLFRYSAVRFNSHRIHFDRHYAVDHEGLPGLIVHGTLIWQLMLELCRAEAPDRPVTEFSYRTYRPIYDIGPFTLTGRPVNDGRTAELWAIDQAGDVATAARAMLSG